MKKIAPALLAMLLLAGCSGEGGETASVAPTGTNRPAETTQAEPEETEEEPVVEETTETPAPPANPVFGDTYTWENGLSVTISAPTPFEPSEFSSIEGAAAHISFDVTIVNGTGANYDPAVFFTSAQSGNAEATQVFDTAQGYGGSPSTTLLPDREAVFKIGYGVADPADVVLEVTPGFEYDAAIFTN